MSKRIKMTKNNKLIQSLLQKGVQCKIVKKIFIEKYKLLF